MSTKRKHSAVAIALAVGGVGLWSASARADDDCYYGTRYTTRSVYVDPVPLYGPRTTTVVYDRSPYVQYTRTYAAPAVRYVEAPVVVYERPVRHRTVYRHARHYDPGYRYGYLFGGVGYGHHRARGWGLSIGGFRHGGHHGHHGHFGRHYRGLR